MNVSLLVKKQRRRSIARQYDVAWFSGCRTIFYWTAGKLWSFRFLVGKPFVEPIFRARILFYDDLYLAGRYPSYNYYFRSAGSLKTKLKTHWIRKYCQIVHLWSVTNGLLWSLASWNCVVLTPRRPKSLSLSYSPGMFLTKSSVSRTQLLAGFRFSEFLHWRIEYEVVWKLFGKGSHPH